MKINNDTISFSDAEIKDELNKHSSKDAFIIYKDFCKDVEQLGDAISALYKEHVVLFLAMGVKVTLNVESCGSTDIQYDIGSTKTFERLYNECKTSDGTVE